MECNQKLSNMVLSSITEDILKLVDDSRIKDKYKNIFIGILKDNKEILLNKVNTILDKNIKKNKKKKTKSKSDLKKPKTSYIHYCISERPNIKKEYPNMKPKDVTRELGKRWRQLTDEQKTPFMNMYMEDKKRYVREKEEHKKVSEADKVDDKKVSEADKVDDKKKKVKKKKNTVKKPKSSYILFCLHERTNIKDSNPDMSSKDIIKELGRIWREDINDERKEHFKNMAIIDKNRYNREIALENSRDNESHLNK